MSVDYQFQAYPKYFNHASVFLYQDIVKEALDYALQRQKRNEKPLFDFISEEKERLINLMRQSFKLSQYHICFGLSVSQFMSHFVWGYTFKPTDAVVVLKDDYPSLTLPWQLLRKKGLTYCALETDLVVKDLTVLQKALKKYRPKFFACSAVHNIKGIRWPLQEMASLCKEHGVYFIVDATQTLGVLDINWDKINPDVLLASTYKWLMWPMGLGFMACSDSILNDVLPATAGARSVSKQFVQSEPSLYWAKQAQAFESGAVNLLTLSAAFYLLNLFSEIGFRTIECKTMALANQLRYGLIEKNYQLYPLESKEQNSQIISVDANYHNQFFEHLSFHNYGLMQKEGFVRLSPAFYQTHTDIKALLDLV